jgi:hypothetical protein
MTTPKLTIGFSTYGQPAMLSYWFDRYLEQPAQWRNQVEVVVVDDCGIPPAIVPNKPEIHLFRIKQDIPWNQPGARNLVAHVAKAPRLMLIDPDMTMEQGMLEKLVTACESLRLGVAFRPILRHVANKVFDRSSPNVHLMMKADFEKIGGYDEDYAGHKGWSDVQLLRVMSSAFVVRDRTDLWFWFHHGTGTDIPDAQVRTLDRDVKHNRGIHTKKMDFLKKKGWWKFVNSLGKRLRFEWEQLQ